MATQAIERLGHQAVHLLAAGVIAGAIALGWVGRRRGPGFPGLLAAAATLGAARLDPVRHVFDATLAAAAVAAVAALAAGVAVGTTHARVHADEPADIARRRFLASTALLLGGVALGATAMARRLRRNRPASIPDQPVDAGFPAVVGLTPLVTSRQAHYTVAVDLEPPVVDATSWRLRVRGEMASPFELTLAELHRLPAVERLATLSCISNTVGGPLVGNAHWAGVPLAALLASAHPTARARALEARGADGYTETLDLGTAARPGVMVAYAMDGAPLPAGHGFPARLRVPAHYGVKNVKWLTDLVVVERPRPGYWNARGWNTDTAVHTESRIDLPAHGAVLTGPTRVAGVAWAADRGIAVVEVSADDGASWLPARLEREADVLSWRRWQTTLKLLPGIHPLSVRATDGAGAVQLAARMPPHPAGATGYHRIVVTVR